MPDKRARGGRIFMQRAVKHRDPVRASPAADFQPTSITDILPRSIGPGVILKIVNIWVSSRREGSGCFICL